MNNEKNRDGLLRSPAGDIISVVESFDDIITNVRNFQQIFNGYNCMAYERFSMFYHWYYLPIDGGIYAPSKFIGYKGTTIKNYNPYVGSGKHGGETEEILDDYFYKVQNDEQFDWHYEQLQNFAHKLGKEINGGIISGRGAIHVPNDKFVAYIKKSNTGNE